MIETPDPADSFFWAAESSSWTKALPGPGSATVSASVRAVDCCLVEGSAGRSRSYSKSPVNSLNWFIYTASRWVHITAFVNDPAPHLELKEKCMPSFRGHCSLWICCKPAVSNGDNGLIMAQGSHSTVCCANPMFSSACSVLSNGASPADSGAPAWAAVQRSPSCFLCGL